MEKITHLASLFGEKIFPILEFSILFIFLLILSFIIFSKIFTPQIVIIKGKAIRMKAERIPVLTKDSCEFIPRYSVFIKGEDEGNAYLLSTSFDSFKKLNEQKSLGNNKVAIYFKRYCNCFTFFDHLEVETA